MANCICEKELKSLQNLVVRLSGEIDYKNLMLMEMEETNADKDRLLGEKSAVITTLTEEKEWLHKEVSEAKKEIEKLANERSVAISVLITQDAEKDKLLEEKSAAIAALIEENERKLKEMSNSKAARNALKVKEERMDYEYLDVKPSSSELGLQKQKFKDSKVQYEEEHNPPMGGIQQCTAIIDLMAEKESLIKKLTNFNVLMGEKDKLLTEKNTAIGKLMAQDAEKVKLIDKLSAKNDALLDTEKRKTRRLQQEIQKLTRELLQSQKEELRKQTKELTSRNRNNYGDKEAVEMDMESKDQVEPLPKEDLRAEVNSLKQQLEEKEEALQYAEDGIKILTVKEVTSNQELQAARLAAIKGFEAMQGRRMLIGIKSVGEMDLKPFRDACSNRFCSGDWSQSFGTWEEKSFELFSSWESELRNPAWQPFKLEVVNGKQTEVIDESDPKLQELRKEWGEEAYKVVTEAVLGLNDYNASGRYPVSELWNHKEDRKATLVEVIEYAIKQWQTHRKTKKKY